MFSFTKQTGIAAGVAMDTESGHPECQQITWREYANYYDGSGDAKA